MESPKPTLIDAHGDVEGNLRGKDAQIYGRFRGEIELTGRLVLGEGARVQARVVADAAEIAGDFRGELKVRSLVLLEKGRLEGTLEAQTMTVREGAHLNGPVNTSSGTGTGSSSSRISGGLLIPPPASGALAG